SESAGTNNEARAAAAEQLKLIGDLQAELQKLQYTEAIGDSRVVDAQCRLFTAYYEDHQPEPANQLLRQMLESESAWSRLSVSNVSFALDNAGRIQLGRKDYANAESLFRENLRIIEKTQPGLSPVFVAEAMLGGTLTKNGQYKQAETYLLHAYEGLKKRQAEGRPSSSRAKTMAYVAQGLTELYELSGNTNKAAEWRPLGTPIKAVSSP
ncbi:MAG TPA: tetratricopeptide repeat protein, partial [Candidatus Saccharimonadales bacterium]|nr:tetratricopeptide repeat protein [Candidatus Saccharimonadales bacterium]